MHSYEIVGTKREGLPLAERVELAKWASETFDETTDIYATACAFLEELLRWPQ